ncbi:TldD-like protein [archaeon]|nr:TldD-like protein [archaeon]
MEKDIANFSIKYLQEKGAEYAEARLEEYDNTGFMLKNNTPEISGFDKNSGLGLRFIYHQTLGFVSINNFDKDKIKQTIDKSLSLTKKSSQIGEKVDLSKDSIYKKNYEVKQKQKIEDLRPEDKINILKELDKDVLNTKVKVPARYFSLSDVLTKKYYINSEGKEITSTIPRINLFYFLTIGAGKKLVQRYWQYGAVSGYEAIKKWNIHNVLQDEIKALDLVQKNGKKGPQGKIDVVAGPEITGIAVHEACGHPYEADRIYGREGAQAGESFVNINSIGEKIGNEAVTVIDDPMIENAFGYYQYDDEGVKAKKKYLMKNGIINEFLHDRQTSFKLNKKSNGSSRASSFGVEPLIRMSNTYIKQGKYSEEELIEGVKNGILMKSFTEWNIDDKRWNQKYVGSEAYLIKNGEIAYPLIRPTIEITTPSLYGSIDAIGKNFELHSASCGKGEPMQGLPVSLGGPSIRIRNITIK